MARGFKASASWPKADRRDLISSARSMKAKGFIPIIAEIKPKVLGRPLTPEEVAAYARAYADNNACAISVLTEPTHFRGSLENAVTARKAGLPVLRKDFIFDERQLHEVQADLVLLIASLGIDLSRFVDLARAHGMEPLVEVHTGQELDEALKTDAKIIGINNRNLNTLEVDLGTFERLAQRAKEAGVFLLAESGIHTKIDAIRMMHAGADALLVGSALMERPKKLGEINHF
jgi:indole-3-glycerol phosphate synthase